jgi:DNA-binding transcriptional LysR family regulator
VLDVRRLALLRELSIRGTIAAVAESVHLSPSAVSQQLTQLEREAGVELLRPVGRRVQLTPEAEILVGSATEVLEVLERAQAALEVASVLVRGTVRVAVFQSAALALMPAALTAMSEQHPEVRIEMTQREPEQALHDTWARDFDMVVAEQYPAHAAPRHPGLERQELTTDAIRLAVPAGSAIRTLEDARDAAWVMEPHGAASRHFAEQRCREIGFEPDVRYQTADLQGQMRLVESGNAVALMPDLIWTGRGTTARLVDLADAPRRRIFTAQRAAGAASPAMREFARVLREAAAHLEG